MIFKLKKGLMCAYSIGTRNIPTMVGRAKKNKNTINAMWAIWF